MHNFKISENLRNIKNKTNKKAHYKIIKAQIKLKTYKQKLIKIISKYYICYILTHPYHLAGLRSAPVDCNINKCTTAGKT